MTNLNCGVGSCSFNCSGLCSLHTIQVGGVNATSSKETNCASYRPGGAATSSVGAGAAKPETAIDCSAKNCCHNENCKCAASNVSICSCGCTAGCDTFKE